MKTRKNVNSKTENTIMLLYLNDKCHYLGEFVTLTVNPTLRSDQLLELAVVLCWPTEFAYRAFSKICDYVAIGKVALAAPHFMVSPVRLCV